MKFPVSQRPFRLSGSSCVGLTCFHQPVRSRNSRRVVPSGTENKRLEFFRAEHERRQEEPGAQQKPDARRAVDRCAESDQRLHVPVDGAYGYGKLLARLRRRDCAAPAAHGAQELEEASGFAHDVVICTPRYIETPMTRPDTLLPSAA